VSGPGDAFDPRSATRQILLDVVHQGDAETAVVDAVQIQGALRWRLDRGGFFGGVARIQRDRAVHRVIVAESGGQMLAGECAFDVRKILGRIVGR
jgi:hypothetical protein